MTHFIARALVAILMLPALFAPLAAAAAEPEELVYLKPLTVTDGKDIFGKDRYNEMKKELGVSKISRQTYPGGVTLYVVQKGQRKGLLTDDFKPVALNFGVGKKDLLAYKFGVTQYNGKTYVLGASEPNNAVGLMHTDGSKVIPEACVGPFYGFKIPGGRFDIFYGSDDKGVNAWNTEWGDVLGVGHNLSFTLPIPEKVETVDGGVKVYHDATSYVFTYEDTDGKNCVVILDPDKKGKDRGISGTGITMIPGNGYCATGDVTVTPRKVTRQTADGSLAEFDEIVIQPADIIKSTALFKTNGQKVVDRCYQIVLSYPDEVAYYFQQVSYKSPTDGKYKLIKRKGVADLHAGGPNIPAAFNDIFVERDSAGTLIPYVRTDYFADVAPYSPDLDNAYTQFNDTVFDFEKAYTTSMSMGNKRFVITSELSKMFQKELLADTISPRHLQMYAIISAIDADCVLATQEDIKTAMYEHDERQANSFLKTHIMKGLDGIRTYGYGGHVDIERNIERFGNYAAKHPEADTTLLASTTGFLSDMLAVIDNNMKNEIPTAIRHYDNYIAQKIEQRRREEAERQAELKRQRNQQIAMAFFNAFSNAANSFASGKSSSRSSSSSFSSRSSSGKGSAGSSSSSSSNSDEKRDRIAWLKGEIITYENKVKRERSRFEEAVRIDESQRTRESHRAMESIKRTYEDAQNQLNQYKLELDALKK